MELLNQGVTQLQELNRQIYAAIQQGIPPVAWAVLLGALILMWAGFQKAPLWTGTLITLASLGVAMFCIAMMLVIDVKTLVPLPADINNPVKPNPILGNHYAGYLGGLFIGIGTAILGYKRAFGYDPVLKQHGRYRPK
ncbi:MAG: hypothetical protein HY320_03605 [Armatimonadetes bacterium]|nr:hypothetical protein [Armatimonadota bacterium]